MFLVSYLIVARGKQKLTNTKQKQKEEEKESMLLDFLTNFSDFKINIKVNQSKYYRIKYTVYTIQYRKYIFLFIYYTKD